MIELDQKVVSMVEPVLILMFRPLVMFSYPDSWRQKSKCITKNVEILRVAVM